jgi:general secretion pathway protein I
VARPARDGAPNRPSSHRRAGLTLLEIVLATALFLGAVSVLAQLIWNGQRAAVQARLRTEAAFRCETKLAELLAGAERFQPVQRMTFPDDPQWSWSAEIGSGQLPELLHVVVTVRRQGNNPAANAEFSLARWTRDPALFAAAAQSQSQSRLTTSSPTTGAGTPSSTSGTGGSR